jgi:hypothetical protein
MCIRWKIKEMFCEPRLYPNFKPQTHQLYVLRHYTAQILSIYRHLQQTVSFILATSLNFQTVIRPVKLRPWGQWY